MQQFKKDFIDLALEYEVLRFGEFTLKSGRQSPYFFNAGLFDTGRALDKLGSCYAQALIDSGLEYDLVFGPAYKGIPLVAVLTATLSKDHGIDKPYAFNRKEAKDHGEGGNIVGSALNGDVLIVDDVITAGTAIREAVDIIRDNGARCSAVMIALDRQERGQGDRSAIQEVQADLGIDVVSIITLDDLIEYLSTDESFSVQLSSMTAYRDQYGV